MRLIWPWSLLYFHHMLYSWLGATYLDGTLLLVYGAPLLPHAMLRVVLCQGCCGSMWSVCVVEVVAAGTLLVGSVGSRLSDLVDCFFVVVLYFVAVCRSIHDVYVSFSVEGREVTKCFGSYSELFFFWWGLSPSWRAWSGRIFLIFISIVDQAVHLGCPLGRLFCSHAVTTMLGAAHSLMMCPMNVSFRFIIISLIVGILQKWRLVLYKIIVLIINLWCVKYCANWADKYLCTYVWNKQGAQKSGLVASDCVLTIVRQQLPFRH